MTDCDILRLMGRCANGAERDGGSRYHAVPRIGRGHALCGVKPGRRSAGWADHPDSHGDAVTCPKCLRKMVAEHFTNETA